jgi:hypothetical protein
MELAIRTPRLSAPRAGRDLPNFSRIWTVARAQYVRALLTLYRIRQYVGVNDAGILARRVSVVSACLRDALPAASLAITFTE